MPVDHTDGSHSQLHGHGHGHDERGFGRLGSANHEQYASVPMVYVVGNVCNMDRLVKICTEHELLRASGTGAAQVDSRKTFP